VHRRRTGLDLEAGGEYGMTMAGNLFRTQRNMQEIVVLSAFLFGDRAWHTCAHIFMHICSIALHM